MSMDMSQGLYLMNGFPLKEVHYFEHESGQVAGVKFFRASRDD